MKYARTCLGKVVTAFLLLCGLAGCSAGGADATAQVERAKQSLLQAQSYAATVTQDTEMEVFGIASPWTTQAHVRCIREPLQMQLEVYMDGEDGGRIEHYLRQEDGAYAVYSTEQSAWDDAPGDWQREEVTQAQWSANTVMLDAENYLVRYLSAAGACTLEGTQTLENGQSAQKIACTLEEGALAAVLETTGIQETLGMRLSGTQLQNLLSGAGELTFFLWVDAQSAHPVRMEIDLTQVLQQILEQANDQWGAGLEGVGMKRHRIVITWEEYDAISEIEIPQEALDAA